VTLPSITTMTNFGGRNLCRAVIGGAAHTSGTRISRLGLFLRSTKLQSGGKPWSISATSLDWIAKQMPIKQDAAREHYLEGFRRAGLN
jgi:hypothetical protein